MRQHKFEELVHAFSSDLFRFAYWMCKDKALAEDMVQETFSRAWKSLDSLQDAKAAKAWLITILRREIARYFERQPKNEQPLSEVELDALRGPEGTESNGYFLLRRTIATLPADYREPFLLQVVDGYSCNEIAEILDIKPGAVMTRVFRARQKLREMLTEDTTNKMLSN